MDVRRTLRRFVGTVLLLTMVSPLCCGGAQKDLDPDIPVDFSFVLDGKIHRISELRRRPLVLVLMRTSEVMSQLYMDGVTEAFVKTAGRLQFLVLTIEPNEAPFVAPYVAFEKLPFPIGVAEREVLLGESALGIVPGVPCTYFIDAEGRPRTVVAGVIDTKVLVEEAERFSKR